MFLREKYWRDGLPVYEVKELTMEEALLVFAAEKEEMLRQADEVAASLCSSSESTLGDAARVA
jgi:hypothetical protein